VNLVECLRARFRDRLVMLAGTAAYADSADHLAGPTEGNPACENHHASLIGGVDTKELTARLRVLRKILGTDVEGSQRECLLTWLPPAIEAAPCAAIRNPRMLAAAISPAGVTRRFQKQQLQLQL
jgi:hypothetical protein